MKQLFDFFPVLIFVIVYFITKDIIFATLILIAASGAQLSLDWVRRRTVEKLHLYTFLVLLVLGGLTVIFRDENFIKWKPTVINWILALVMIGGQFIGNKNIIQRMVEGLINKTPNLSINIPDSKWLPLNLTWAAFFVFLGCVNIYVAYNYSTDTWVTFKLVGMTGINMIFLIGQFLYLSRFIEETNEEVEGTPDKQPPKNNND